MIGSALDDDITLLESRFVSTLEKKFHLSFYHNTKVFALGPMHNVEFVFHWPLGREVDDTANYTIWLSYANWLAVQICKGCVDG